MKLSESLSKAIYNTLHLTNHKIVDIKRSRSVEETHFSVTFIRTRQTKRNAPIFDIVYHDIDLKMHMRDEYLNEILSHEVLEFDVEDYIFTDEQRKKLERLRENNKVVDDAYAELKKVRKEYSETFSVGQDVWYNDAPGIITFKHTEKSETDIMRWSIVVKDIEYRYVDGTKLLARKKIDTSHIAVDPKLNKLSTERLLKMFKNKRVKGVGDIRIKRILDEREHIGTKEKKIVLKG